MGRRTLSSGRARAGLGIGIVTRAGLSIMPGMKAAAHDTLIFGQDPTPGIVAVEHVAGRGGAPDEVALVRDDGGGRTMSRAAFTPFLWLAAPDLLAPAGIAAEYQELAGPGELRCLALFRTWAATVKAVQFLKKNARPSRPGGSPPFHFVNDPVQQYLLLSGQTLFKNLPFAGLRRMQVDLETYTTAGYEFPNADRPGDRIIAIAMADQSGWVEVLSGAQHDEPTLLRAFVERLRERDPDVIEGHNIFKFDLPYLAARARRCGVELAIGRDGRAPASHSSRVTFGDLTISYPKAEIFGRHVADTYFLTQFYDLSHRELDGLGLKDVARHFGLAPANRTYVEGADISRVFDREPERLMAYAGDDVRETRALGDLLAPVYWAQAQLLPLAYQDICVRGPAAKIDALLVREYLRQRHALPQPSAAREFAGGYTDVFVTGLCHNVHHADVRSLYPSLMLKDRIGPQTDDLGVFLALLDYLRGFRLDARARMQKAATPDERTGLDALQSAFKLLINSFYGYLGFSQARFNDFAAAARVTAAGRDLMQCMLDWLRARDARPVEIDTDGIYFMPPDLPDAAARQAFRDDFQRALPEGIEIDFDGEYPAMFSYKMKNYALLQANGSLVLRGAALKSRGLEPFQRQFLRDLLRARLEGREASLPALKKKYAQAIFQRTWPIQMLAKTETLQDAPAAYLARIKESARGRNAAYELALRSGRDYQAGDQVSYYVTGTRKSVSVHSSARLVADWNPDQRDENIAYYLAKLDALYDKFTTPGGADADEKDDD